MYSFTVIGSAVTCFISILVLAALHINKDDSQAKRCIQTAIAFNTLGLIAVLITYSLCAYAAKYSPLGQESDLFQISYILRDISDLFVAPVGIAVVDYFHALSDKRMFSAMRTKAFRNFMVCLVVLQTIDLGIYDLGMLFGFASPTWAEPVYNIETLIGALFILALGFVVFTSLREMDRQKGVCFVLYLASQICGILLIMITEESVFFGFNAALLMFLFLALQTDQIDMSNLETVRSAMQELERVNARLEQSLEDLRREQFLLKEISDIYTSLYVVDLEGDTYREISSAPSRVEYLFHTGKAKTDNQKLMHAIMQKLSKPEFTEEALRFTDFSTLSERLQGRKFITFEMINDLDKWYRFSFIRIGGGLYAPVREVIFTAQDVDRERREQEKLKRVSYIDEMTNVYNRNAYAAHMAHGGDVGILDPLWVVMIDINELKFTNDTLGHEAGDELIRAAAFCLKNAIGENGTVYRNGGDEFVAFVQVPRRCFDHILRAIEECRASWRGRHGNALYFSVGCVFAGDYPGLTLEALVDEADKRMYEDKKAFYAARPEFNHRRS